MKKGETKEKEGRRQGRVRFIVTNLIRALLIFAFIGALVNQRNLILFISALAFLVTFLPLIFKRLFDIELPAQFEVIVILFIYGALLFGEVHGFNAEFWWWSVLINLASAIALGLVGLAVMYALYKGDKIHASPLVIAFFAFCFAVAIGTLWEFFEYFIDYLFGFSLQKSSNPMIDMVANVVGAFTVSLLGYHYIKNGKVIIISKLISRFVERNPGLFGDKDDNHKDKILNLIKEGESDKVEFKATLRTNLYTNQVDRQIEHAVLKTITAYLNSNGGTLLVGISDKGELLGIENDNFPSADKANVHFNNLIREHIGGEYLPFIKYQIINLNGKSVLKIDCKKSDKEVFLKHGKDERFYVRNGASSVELFGRALVDYIQHSFKNK